jgi:hypothetical protein
MSLLHFRFNERRRTVRVTLTVGLTVRGRTSVGQEFSVQTHSESVSREGGLFPMDEPVVVGQPLQVINENTGKAMDCKVTTIRKARNGQTYVGMEFLSQTGNFWHMCFPAPGARPVRRSKVSV